MSWNGWTALHFRPVDSLFVPWMHNSDNFFAEQTLLMVGNEKWGYMNDGHTIDDLLQNDLDSLPRNPAGGRLGTQPPMIFSTAAGFCLDPE